MKKGKISVLLLSVLFLLFVNSDLFARGGSTSSSFSSSSSSRSSSFSSSSPSRSYSTSPSRSYSSSPSRSYSGSGSRTQSSQTYSGSGTRSQSSKFAGGTGDGSKPAMKSSYDSNARVAASHDSSKAKFEAYNSKNTVSNAGASVPISQNTRDARMGTVYTTYKPSGYYTPPPSNTVVVYRDNYNSNFLQYATLIWMFHHWDSVDKSRFDKERLANLEAKMKEMESQGVKRDPNYTQPGVDKDLQYKNVAYDKEDEGLGFFGWFIVIIGISLILVPIAYYFMKNKRRSRWV